MKTHTVMLPSKGLLNNIEPSIIIREMSVEVEKEILSNHTPTEKIINIVQCCLETPGINVADLPLVDITYLLFEIRALLEPEYFYPVQCDFCGFSFRHPVTIPGDFEIMYAPDDLAEPMPLELPCGDTLGLVFLRGSDQLEIERRAKVLLQQRSKGFRPGKGQDMSGVSVRNIQHTARMVKQIHTINGEEKGQAEKQAYVSKMLMRDSNAIKDFFDSESFGMDTEVLVTCPSCSQEDFHIIQMRPEFFRPGRRGRGSE